MTRSLRAPGTCRPCVPLVGVVSQGRAGSLQGCSRSPRCFPERGSTPLKGAAWGRQTRARSTCCPSPQTWLLPPVYQVRDLPLLAIRLYALLVKRCAQSAVRGLLLWYTVGPSSPLVSAMSHYSSLCTPDRELPLLLCTCSQCTDPVRPGVRVLDAEQWAVQRGVQRPGLLIRRRGLLMCGARDRLLLLLLPRRAVAQRGWR